MDIRRILVRAMAMATLLAGLAGCTQFETYGTLDTGVVAGHVSTPQ
jgi:hypothetical protein